jgi:hypothetical protein
MPDHSPLNSDTAAAIRVIVAGLHAIDTDAVEDPTLLWAQIADITALNPERLADLAAATALVGALGWRLAYPGVNIDKALRNALLDYEATT